MPEMMLAEQPQQKQQPQQQVRVPIYNPQQVRIEALTKVTQLIETCKAELRENQNQQGIISSFSIVIKPEYKQETLAIYNKVVQETNTRLKAENAQFHLSGELKGDSFYFVAGYRDEQKALVPDLSLSEETYQKIMALAVARMEQVADKEKYLPRIQRLGNAIIFVVQDLVEMKNDVPGIMTPQELATAMLDYKEKRTVLPPVINCIGASLLTNEFLYLSGFESSIITLHPINKYGEEKDGHATAAVVADGWLIDPVLQIKPKKISKITLDKNDKNYAKFAKSMEAIYLKKLGKNLDDDNKPVMLEFHEDRQENELEALYHLENGIRLGKHGKAAEGSESIIEASRLNPKNFYAVYNAANIYRGMENKNERAKKEEADILGRLGAITSDLYLANRYATELLFNTKSEDGTKPFLGQAFEHAKKAEEIFEKEGKKFYFGYLWVKLTAEQLGKQQELQGVMDKIKEAPQPPLEK